MKKRKNSKRKNPMISGVKNFLEKCINYNNEVIVADKFLVVRGILRNLGDDNYGILKYLPNGMGDAEFKIKNIDNIDFNRKVIWLSENPKSEIVD